MVFYTDRFIPAGSKGCARGPVIFIRPEARGDEGLLAHEKVHRAQFWRKPFIHSIFYLWSREYRFAAEAEAYRVQLTCGLDPAVARERLKTKYDLGADYAARIDRAFPV